VAADIRVCTSRIGDRTAVMQGFNETQVVSMVFSMTPDAAASFRGRTRDSDVVCAALASNDIFGEPRRDPLAAARRLVAESARLRMAEGGQEGVAPAVAALVLRLPSEDVFRGPPAMFGWRLDLPDCAKYLESEKAAYRAMELQRQMEFQEELGRADELERLAKQKAADAEAQAALAVELPEEKEALAQPSESPSSSDSWALQAWWSDMKEMVGPSVYAMLGFAEPAARPSIAKRCAKRFTKVFSILRAPLETVSTEPEPMTLEKMLALLDSETALSFGFGSL
jgi:hypothetical protein